MKRSIAQSAYLLATHERPSVAGSMPVAHPMHCSVPSVAEKMHRSQFIMPQAVDK